MTVKLPAKQRAFYGWRIVMVCGLVAVIGWSLAVFGMGVYIHALSEQRGFSISLVSSAVTLSYLVNAACLMTVGSATAELGPKPVLAIGTVVLSASVAGLAFCDQTWQLFALLAAMGIGRSCLSTTTISTTLAPWFEIHQGRAVSLALLGASVGGMIGTPLLLGGIALFGIKTAFLLVGAASTLVLLPILFVVLKNSPQELGLLPDGGLAGSASVVAAVRWSRKGAMATRQFRSQLLAFALALLVQITFLSHHVPMVAPILGDAGASLAVTLAAVAAFVGRIMLARFADRIDLRITTAGVLLFGTIALAYLAVAETATSLMIASVMYGLTIGNITTLSPLIARREFGAVSFGAVFGLISAAIAFAMAFGPAFGGLLRDNFGSYHYPLLMASVINVAAAVVIVWGGRKPLPLPS